MMWMEWDMKYGGDLEYLYSDKTFTDEYNYLHN